MICAASLLGILFRPRGIAEWVWALSGATALVLFRLVSFGGAWDALRDGTDVYLFLTGMLLLSEIARSTGVFAWVAGVALAASRGSALRLFAIVYVVGTAVTVVLSNDATAIVLTPAVAAAARRANIAPLPYLFACVFVANAASFVLPISNPTNLIVFGAAMPPLLTWLAVLGLPSLAALVVTFVALAVRSRRELRGATAMSFDRTALGRSGAVALCGIGFAGTALTITSALRGPIGIVTVSAALLALAAVTVVEHDRAVSVVRSISWSILPLVAGLFVLVRGLETAGTLAAVRVALAPLGHATGVTAIAAFGFGTALLANLTNNLPLGVVVGQTFAHGSFPESARYAADIGIALGPNLSVTGSLATILWLVVLRRENIAMNAWQFLRVGIVVMPPALVAALAVLAAGA